jgi:iron(III) transport system ATP-binding protein
MYLTLENITKVFPSRGNVGEVTAVQDVNLEIQKGELVTLLGPSGCGKTTTLRMIAGFEFPSSGRIILDGQEINALPPHKREMSMVFQSYALFPHLTVFENVAYGLNVQRLSKKTISERVGRVLDLVHLQGYGDRAPGQLSGGQQQRVALARALVMEPKVLLMDAMTLSDRIVVMNEGLIEQIGSPVDIYRYPNSRFVANFIGRANFIQGTVLDQKNSKLTVQSLGEQITLSNIKREFREGEPVTLIIRPEMIQIKKKGGIYQGVISQAVYLGDMIEYAVEVGGVSILGTETDPHVTELFPEGENVTLGFAEDVIQVLPAEKS